MESPGPVATEGNDCLLQCGGKVVGLTYLYSNRDLVFRRRVGACGNCGHVQIVPLYKEADQRRINHLWHSHFVGGSNQEVSRRKKAETLARVSGFLNGSAAMLDVGPGEGWSGEIASQFGMIYGVVEPMTDLHASLRVKGAEIAAQSIAGVTGSYDLILLRHVLEHLTDPLETLQHLCSRLSETGVIYVAVPDFNQLAGRKGYRTNSLRPVHLSYFTLNKLLWLLSRSGLKVLAHGSTGELWAVAERGEFPFGIENEFDANAERIRDMVRKNLMTDSLNILRFAAMKFKKCLTGKASVLP